MRARISRLPQWSASEPVLIRRREGRRRKGMGCEFPSGASGRKAVGTAGRGAPEQGVRSCPAKPAAGALCSEGGRRKASAGSLP